MLGGRCLFGYLLLTAACSASPAAGHSVVADGLDSEWFAQLPPVRDLARVQRDLLRRGEWVWGDRLGDAGSGPSAALDLHELRVTGDLVSLHVLARFATSGPCAGAGAPQLQLALDLDRLPGSGEGQFVGNAGTALHAEAFWERLVCTRFGSGSAPRVYLASGGALDLGVAACSGTGVVEVTVPWAALGLQGPPESALRLSAAVFASRADDSVQSVRPSGASQAVDAITFYGDPGRGDSTGAEVADGILDHHVDLWFDADGDIIAPLLLSELYFEDGVNSHWIEVYCAARSPVALHRFRLGDAHAPDSGGNEAMAVFPAVVLSPRQSFVVARRGATFLSDHGFRADAECMASDAGTPDMLPDPGWSPQSTFLLPGGGDECLVVEQGGTVVDVVTYGVGSWPGVGGRGSVGGLHSLERSAPDDDRDDGMLDFSDQPAPSPGVTADATLAVAPDGTLELSAPRPEPSHGPVTWTLSLPTATGVLFDVHDASGRRIREHDAGVLQAGRHPLRWDGRAADGSVAAPGLYWVRIRTRLGEIHSRCVRLD